MDAGDMTGSVTDAMSAEYPAEFAEVVKVCDALGKLEGSGRPPTLLVGRRLLAVALTPYPSPEQPESVVPVVIIATDDPRLRFWHAGASEVPSDEVDVMLEETQQKVRELADVNVSVLGVPLPSEQADVTPGDQVRCGRSTGTFGVQVSAPGVSQGVFTAGHVVATNGMQVEDARRQRVGTVHSTMYGLHKNVAARQLVADVAVVELDPTTHCVCGSTPQTLQTSAPTRWDRVTSYGAITSGVSAVLLAVGSDFAHPDSRAGDWKDTMITKGAISTRGDSGAPVFDDNGDLIGHIVAGARSYSVIQSVSCLLAETQATLR